MTRTIRIRVTWLNHTCDTTHWRVQTRHKVAGSQWSQVWFVTWLDSVTCSDKVRSCWISEEAGATHTMQSSEGSICGADRPNDDTACPSVGWWEYHWSNLTRYCHCISFYLHISNDDTTCPSVGWWAYHWSNLMRYCQRMSMCVYIKCQSAVLLVMNDILIQIAVVYRLTSISLI